MGIEDFVEKAAGVLAAEKALEAADPDAGFLAKAAAAVAGYEGVGMLKEKLSEATRPAATAPAQDDASEADAAPSDDQPGS